MFCVGYGIYTRERSCLIPTVCAFYPDSQTVETLRSACIFMCRLVMLFLFKKHFGTSSVISDQASIYMCSLIGVSSAVAPFM